MLLEFSLRFLTWVGVCWLVVNWTNTLHGSKHNRHLLDRLLWLHHLGILASPLILFGYPKLSNHWNSSQIWMNFIPQSPEQLLVAAGLLGSFGFLLQIIRYHYQRLTAPLKILTSQTINYPPSRYKAPEANKNHWLYFPGNEIWQIEFNTKELLLDPRWQNYQGLKILHLSDLHFIGFNNLQFYVDALQEALQKSPDLIIFSGDLLDHDRYLPWIEPALKPLADKFPCYFVLGNHDWAKSDFKSTRQELKRCGWIDLAGQVTLHTLNDKTICLAGSELPWMNENPDSSSIPPDTLSILVSHSPDQFLWASRRNISLVLAGHTHGGQIVIPFIGPIYSPSVYGTQYAAGTFKCQNTIMHVSRGIGGENPLRLNCSPEISLLILK